MDNHLEEYLKKNNFSYTLFKHPAVFTVEQSKNEPAIKNIPGTRTKSLFLKNENSSFYLITLVGEKRLNIKALEKHLKVKHLQFASSEELKAQLDVNPGSVSLFSILNGRNISLIIDKEIWKADFAGYHPNINTETLVLSKEALKTLFKILKCKKEVIELA